jgi:putative oxidoreductase
MNDAVFLVARAMLALIFLVSGFGKLMAVAGISGMLQKMGFPQSELMGYAIGIFELVAGLLILVGFMTRWAALGLFVFTGITIFMAHNFWTMEGAQFAAQRIQAMKNIAMMGGLLLLAFAGPGGYSVDARAGGRWGTRSRY